jgi:methionine sulfoxide reductase heme-binding subunit
MNTNDVLWLVARGSGVAAVVAFTASVVLGLALSLKASSPRWPRVLTTEVHRLLTLVSFGLIGLHMGTLFLDPEAGVSLVSLFVPFVLDYRTVGTGLGVVALYLVAFIWLSTVLRTKIGYKRWRRLHGVAFAAYAAAMLHGVIAGTDRGEFWTTFVYLTSVVAVGSLIAVRVWRSRQARSRRAIRPTPAPQSPQARPVEKGLPSLGARAPRPAGGSLPPL